MYELQKVKMLEIMRTKFDEKIAEVKAKMWAMIASGGKPGMMPGVNGSRPMMPTGAPVSGMPPIAMPAGWAPPGMKLPPFPNVTFPAYSELNCTTTLPPMSHFMFCMPAGAWVLVVILLIFVIATIALYIEEVKFILRTFKIGMRRKKTIWVLSVFPVYAFCGFIAIIVPKSGPLCDIITNFYFGTVLYNFFRLMLHYMGGAKRMFEIVEPGRTYAKSAAPCCCCPCLGKEKFSRAKFFKMNMMVLQLAIVRPMYSFLAAVLFSNGAYQADIMSPRSGFIWILIMNAVSTLTAIYGLMLLREVLKPNLEVKFAIIGKIASFQLTIILTFLITFFIGIFAKTGVIACTPMFTAIARADAISHCIQIFIMFILSILGRKFFRRACDAESFADGPTKVIQDDPDAQEINGNLQIEMSEKSPALRHEDSKA